MESYLVLLVLAAAVMHASWNAVVKRAGDRLVMQAFIIATSAVIALPFALTLPFPQPETWGYIIAGVTVHGVYFALLVKAYELGDFSHVYPVARGTGPLIVAVAAALLLDESLTPTQIAGVGLISLGIMSMAFTSRGKGDRKALGAALGVGVTISIYTMIDGLGARSGDGPFAFISWLLVLSALPIGGLALWRRGFAPAMAAARHQIGPGLFAGSICGLGYAIVLWAYSQGALAAIAALRETSVIFAAMIGAFLFAEPFGRRRIAAAALVALGVVVLNLSG